MQQQKALITEKKDQNQCRSENVFYSNIYFQCAGTQNDYEKELKFIETWLATPCLDEIYTEDVDMNDEDDMHDEHVNEILMHWSFEEIRYYSNPMLQRIDDEKSTTEYNMWQQPAFLEDVQNILRQPRKIEDLQQQMKKQSSQGYSRAKNLKQFRGYRIWKKRRRKQNLVEVNFF